MTERFYMYSCILHEEVEKGNASIKELAKKMKLPLKMAENLYMMYSPKYEKYHALTLDELLRVRKHREAKMEEIRKRIPSAEHAFNMPISKSECSKFMAIKERVIKDSYLPVGYRNPKTAPAIVHNKSKYE